MHAEDTGANVAWEVEVEGETKVLVAATFTPTADDSAAAGAGGAAAGAGGGSGGGGGGNEGNSAVVHAAALSTAAKGSWKLPGQVDMLWLDLWWWWWWLWCCSECGQRFHTPHATQPLRTECCADSLTHTPVEVVLFACFPPFFAAVAFYHVLFQLCPC